MPCGASLKQEILFRGVWRMLSGEQE